MEIGEGVWVSPCLCSIDEHPSPPEWLSPLHIQDGHWGSGQELGLHH